MKNFDRATVHQNILIERGVGGGVLGWKNMKTVGIRRARTLAFGMLVKERTEKRMRCV